MVQYWCVADNLLKGAATNAVQIAESLVGVRAGVETRSRGAVRPLMPCTENLQVGKLRCGTIPAVRREACHKAKRDPSGTGCLAAISLPHGRRGSSSTSSTAWARGAPGDVVKEEYVRRNASPLEIEEISADPRLVEAARQHLRQDFGSGNSTRASVNDSRSDGTESLSSLYNLESRAPKMEAGCRSTNTSVRTGTSST